MISKGPGVMGWMDGKLVCGFALRMELSQDREEDGLKGRPPKVVVDLIVVVYGPSSFPSMVLVSCRCRWAGDDGDAVLCRNASLVTMQEQPPSRLPTECLAPATSNQGRGPPSAARGPPEEALGWGACFFLHRGAPAWGDLLLLAGPPPPGTGKKEGGAACMEVTEEAPGPEVLAALEWKV